MFKPSPQKPPVVNYQTGFNANRQGVNSGQIQGQMAKDMQAAPQQQSVDGNRGVQDLQNSMLYNSQAQMQRGLEQQNSQKSMEDQAMRSDLLQTGLANQAKIYGDITSRSVDQIGLAAKLQEAMTRSKFALSQALLR